ncbi:MAG: Ig-like domain-containing protein, partial [Opitutaceae bacterium]|nr:Ig-like domain-containing protein [Opitutaceae bacterium]
QIDATTWTATFTATSGNGLYSVAVADHLYADLAANLGTGDSAPLTDASIRSVRFTDGFVNGVAYTTSSGLSGLTGDAGPTGSFNYREGDTISFRVGGILVSEFQASAVQGEYLFLQDIAGVALSNLNDMYVENLAIFLQLLDDDGDAANGIHISSLIRTAAENVTLDLRASDKQALSDALMELSLLANFAILFTADSELSADGRNVFETQAMAHVRSVIEALAGTRLPSAFDARLADVIDSDPAPIRYNFNTLAGTITFDARDLLANTRGQQVFDANLVVKNVRLAASSAHLGTLIDNGDDTYTIQLVDGLTPYDLENLRVDYTVQDWTVTKEVSAYGLDTYKSHLSYTIDAPGITTGSDGIPVVPEDTGYVTLTIKSALTFGTDQALSFAFTSERLSTAALSYAEFGDDFILPFEYSNDGGSTWQLMSDFKVFLHAGNDTLLVRVPVFDDGAVEAARELFDGTILGDAFYDEKVQFWITDNDAPSDLPQLRIDFVYVVENAGFVDYTVRMDNPSDVPVTVEYFMQEFGATAGVDYEHTTGVLTFAPGETVKTIRVPVIDDLAPEQLEFALMNLRNASNALISDTQGTLRIFDNDITPRTATISAPVVTESADHLLFTIDLDQAFTSAALLDVSVSTTMDAGTYGPYEFSLNGGRTWDVFNPVKTSNNTGHIIVQPGVSQFLVRVGIDDPDTIPELDDTFAFRIAANYAITDDAEGVALLRNDDGSSITINPVTDDGILSSVESGLPFTPVTGSVIGDATPGDTVTVVVNGVTYTGTLDDDLTFRIEVATSDLLASPVVDASFTSTGPDAVERTVTTDRAVILDLAATTPTVDPYAGNDTTPVLTGTAPLEVGETLSVTVNGVTYTQGDGRLTVTDGRWTLQIPPENALPEGRIDVTATVTDAVGNTASDSTLREVLVLTAQPPRANPLGVPPIDPFANPRLPGAARDWVPPVFAPISDYDDSANDDFLGLGGMDHLQQFSVTLRGFPVFVIMSDVPSLILYRGVPDQFMESNDPFNFTIPIDAFVHSSSEAQVILNATLTDGRPLPDWLHFNRTTGVFEGEPPANFVGELRVKVIARDAQGLQAEAVFRLFIGTKPAPKTAARDGVTAQFRAAALAL